eukprot:gene32336-39923_t
MAPGLALDGPVGSMARSVDGMKAELPTVTFFFVLMMCSFFCTTILGSWNMMMENSAIEVSCIFFVAGYLCFKYVYRSYFRFTWTKSEVHWDGSVDDPQARRSSVDTRPSEQRYTINNRLKEDPALAEASKKREERSWKFFNSMFPSAKPQQPTVLNGGTNFTHRPSDQRPSDHRPSTMDARPSLYGMTSLMGRLSMGARPSMAGAGQRPSVLELMPNINTNSAQSPANPTRKINLKDVAMEGYLSKRIKSKKEFSHEPWERRYFVLNYKGEIFFYKSRPVYRSDPIGGREEKNAIELDDYLVKYYNSITPHALEPIAAKYDDGNSEDKTSTELEFTVESSVDSSHTKSTRKSLAAKVKQTVLGDTKGIFQFKLVPLTGREVGLHYGLRADTEEEFTLWLEAMQSVSIANFEESYFSDK